MFQTKHFVRRPCVTFVRQLRTRKINGHTSENINFQASDEINSKNEFSHSPRFQDGLGVTSQNNSKLKLRHIENQNRFTYKRPNSVKSHLNLNDEDEFEITELGPNKVHQKEPKKLFGKDIAEDFRSSKRIARPDPQKQQAKNSVKTSDYTKLSDVEFAKVLRRKVIYVDENIAVISKPYGVAAHDGDSPSLNMKSCFPVLSKMIYGLNTAVPLFLCNRLDKSTTGITVCATNKNLASKIKKLFREQKVRKKYWAFTVGEPNPSHGIIDIPLIMRNVDGGRMFKSHQRMALAPEQKIDYETGKMIDIRPRKPNIAITHYRILDLNDGLALVEFQPMTTVKHQIRVHAAEALSCCILGDHKFSTEDKLLPQRLPKNVLSRFGIRSTRSRDMPMHLHLREIVIPGILENTAAPNLLVSAKLPEHMYRTSKLFRLKPGAMTDFKYPTRLDEEIRHPKNDPLMEELYHDPFADSSELDKIKEDIQRVDCYTVYRPKIKVKFQYHNTNRNEEGRIKADVR